MNDYVGPDKVIYLGIGINIVFILLGLYVTFLLITFLRLGIKVFRKYLNE